MENITNMSPELLALFMFHTVGVSVFGKFEAETAWWRLTLKWIVLLGITYWVYSSFGHSAALLTIFSLAIIGVAFHVWWCRKNQIHPLHATPRRRYYELRNWEWKE